MSQGLNVLVTKSRVLRCFNPKPNLFNNISLWPTPMRRQRPYIGEGYHTPGLAALRTEHNQVVHNQQTCGMKVIGA